MKRALIVLVSLLSTSCAVGRAIRDATYPDFVEVQYPDGSKAAGVWLCVAERRPDPEGHVKADLLICTDGARFYETLVGEVERGMKL